MPDNSSQARDKLDQLPNISQIDAAPAVNSQDEQGQPDHGKAWRPAERLGRDRQGNHQKAERQQPEDQGALRIDLRADGRLSAIRVLDLLQPTHENQGKLSPKQESSRLAFLTKIIANHPIPPAVLDYGVEQLNNPSIEVRN